MKARKMKRLPKKAGAISSLFRGLGLYRLIPTHHPIRKANCPKGEVRDE